MKISLVKGNLDILCPGVALGLRGLENWVSWKWRKNFFVTKSKVQGENCFWNRSQFLKLREHGPKKDQISKLTTPKTQNFQNLNWHLNSIYFSDQKTPLTSILLLNMMELQAVAFYNFWGPALPLGTKYQNFLLPGLFSCKSLTN